MRKIWIKRAIIGSILIAIIVAGLGFAGYKWAKQYYYDELENRINNLYLEGEDAIGFYNLLLLPGMSTELYSNEYKYTNFSTWMKLFENGKLGELKVKTWPDLVSLNGYDYEFSNIPFVNSVYYELADSKKFAWWTSVNPIDKFGILKKTEKGFDFIDEYIMGIGFKFLPPCEIKNTEFKLKHKTTITEYIYTDFYLCEEYIDYLIEDKYGNVKMRRNVNAYDRLVKDLQKYIRGSKIIYFGNDFYELRPDKNYLYGGYIYANYNT